MYAFNLFAAASTLATVAFAKEIVVTVGHNTTNNASAVFEPYMFTAKSGDTVIFNFTLGNHTAIQSDFSTPCIPLHETNETLNGFWSGYRDAGNATAITTLTVPITPEMENKTTWFYDANTCGKGGVGGINVNASSWETMDGFQRNAVRLNGTGGSTSSRKPSSTQTGSESGQTGSSGNGNGAERLSIVAGVAAVLPLALIAVML